MRVCITRIMLFLDPSVSYVDQLNEFHPITRRTLSIYANLYFYTDHVGVWISLCERPLMNFTSVFTFQLRRVCITGMMLLSTLVLSVSISKMNFIDEHCRFMPIYNDSVAVWISLCERPLMNFTSVFTFQ